MLLKEFINFLFVLSHRTCRKDNQSPLSNEESETYARLFRSGQQLQTAILLFLTDTNCCVFADACDDGLNNVQIQLLSTGQTSIYHISIIFHKCTIFSLSVVLTHLSDIADVIMDLNIRCASEVWKCLLKFSQESYKLCMHSQFACSDWMFRAVQVLCSHIKSDLLILKAV